MIILLKCLLNLYEKMLIKKILLGDSADFSDDIEDKCLDNIKSRLFCLHFCDWIVVEI